MMHIQVDRALLQQSLQKIRPWIRKNRKNPVRSAIRITAKEGGRLRILAGSFAGQGRVDIPAEVLSEGEYGVDGISLQNFVRYAEGETLELLGTDAYLVCRSKEIPEQQAIFPKADLALFPDVALESASRETLNDERVPDDVYRMCRQETSGADVGRMLRFFSFSDAGHLENGSDLLSLRPRSRYPRTLECVGFTGLAVFFLRKTFPGGEDLPSREWIVSRKEMVVSQKLFPKTEDPACLEFFPWHLVWKNGHGERSCISAYKPDTRQISNPSKCLSPLAGRKQLISVRATAREWKAFLEFGEVLYPATGDLMLEVGKNTIGYHLQSTECEIEKVAEVACDKKAKGAKIVLDPVAAMMACDRLDSVDPDGLVSLSYRDQTPFLYWMMERETEEFVVVQGLKGIEG